MRPAARDEALAAYRRARDLGEALFRANPEDPNIGHELARNLGNMGVCLSDAGRPAEALAAFDRAQEVLKVVGDANPTIVRIPAASAWIDTSARRRLVALGRDDEALEALERARAAREILIKANPDRHAKPRAIDPRPPPDRRHPPPGRADVGGAGVARAGAGGRGEVGRRPPGRPRASGSTSPRPTPTLGDLLGAMGKPSEALACVRQGAVDPCAR